VTGPPAPPPRYGRMFWALLPVGGLFIAWGLTGLLRNAASSVPASWLRWFIGGLLAEDLLLIPAILAMGLAIRHLPAGLQPPARAALIVSGTLALMSVPLLLGYGRSAQPGNSSVLPGDYPASLGITVGAVWAAAAIWSLVRLLRALGRRGR
jgi:hypothetical protein